VAVYVIILLPLTVTREVLPRLRVLQFVDCYPISNMNPNLSVNDDLELREELVRLVATRQTWRPTDPPVQVFRTSRLDDSEPVQIP
jgi:hypothetical protein